MRIRNSVVALALLSASLMAAEGAKLAKPVEPFVDATTAIVARVDLTRVDVDAIQQWIVDLLKPTLGDDKELAQTLEQIKQRSGMMRDYIAELKAAGMRDLFLLSPMPPKNMPLFIFPLADGADAKQIEKLIRRGPEKDNQHLDEHLAATTANGCLVVSEKPQIEALKNLAPVARPRLAEAFDVIGDAPVGSVILLDEQTRKLMDQGMGQLPPAVALAAAGLSASIDFATFSAQLPPKASATLTIQAVDAKTAMAMQLVATALLTIAKQNPAAAKISELITMKTDGNRLVVTMDSQQVQAMGTQVLVPLINQSRERAKSIMSMSNMRQLMQGCLAYSIEHNDAWPDTLEAVIDPYIKTRKVLVNPQQPQRQEKGYVYIKPAAKMAQVLTPSATIVIHEAYDQWPGGLGVGFADGHVERIASEAKFKEMIEKSTAGK